MKNCLKILIILLFLVSARPAFAAVTFLEPGGDATFDTSFWSLANSGILGTVASDFVHGSHQKSLKPAPSTQQCFSPPDGSLPSGAGRVSIYFYINTLPSSDSNFLFFTTAGDSAGVAFMTITSAGVLKLEKSGNIQIGSNGATLSTGQWYRISIAYSLTSTTVNRFETFVNGVPDISVTNASLTTIAASTIQLGTANLAKTLDARYSDIYIDNDNSLTDTGDVWVTAKRPVSNGTSNQFTTQIGSGGSGYGSGHAPQVNERALSTTNGWSITNASTQTEEYSIEGKSVGDTDITYGTILDYVGWVYAKVGSANTGHIIVGGNTSNISLTTSYAMYTKAAGSSTYPAGNTDIGMDTNGVNQLFSLADAGIMVAYIPGVAPTFPARSGGAVTLPPNNLGLIGYWSMNEGNGTIATDFSGNGNNGTLSGSTLPSWVSGKVGKALSFDGSTSYVSVPQRGNFNLSGHAFTISTWVRDDTPAATLSGVAHRVVSWYDGTKNIQLALGSDSGGTNRVFYVYNATGAVSASQVSTGNVGTGWHHAVATFDGISTYHIYVDGVQLDGGNTSTGASESDPSTLYIGQKGDGTRYVLGNIDEVRIYNRALSADEVASLYGSNSKYTAINKSPVVISNGLVGWWTLDGKDTNWATGIVNDVSGTGNNGNMLHMSTTTSPVLGQIGQALKFVTGSSQAVDANSTADSIQIGDATFSAWIMLPAAYGNGSPTEVIADSGDTPSNNDLRLNLGSSGTSSGTDGKLHFDFWNGSTLIQTGSGRNSWLANTPYFVVGTYSASTGVKLYINGIQDGSSGAVARGTTPYATHFRIGGNSVNFVGGPCNGIPCYFNGTIDDVRIYNRALSVAEITQLYNGTKTTVNKSHALIPSGLVGWWTMDGGDTSFGSNTELDKSGSGNGGVLKNLATSTTPVSGKIGQALAFDGSSSYIAVSSASSLNFGTGDFTLTAWIKANQSRSDWRDIAVKYPGNITWQINKGGSGCGFGTDTAGATMMNEANNQVICGRTVVDDGKWHFVTYQRSGTQRTITVDGVTDVSVSDSTVPNMTGTDELDIGRLTGGTQNFNGDIDDLRMYSRALSPNELIQLYRQGK